MAHQCLRLHIEIWSQIFMPSCTNCLSGHICTSVARVCSWCQEDILQPVTGKSLTCVAFHTPDNLFSSSVPGRWGETQLQHSLTGLISILSQCQSDALIQCLCVSTFKESWWPHVYPVFVNKWMTGAWEAWLKQEGAMYGKVHRAAAPVQSSQTRMSKKLKN